MNRIASFAINHDLLKPGIYTSRIDGDVVTYDIRMVRPNCGEYPGTAALHTFEHLFATYVRNSPYGGEVVYAGPMGCRTGFYFLVRDTLQPVQAIGLILQALEFIAGYEGEIPGSTPIECGNAAEHDLAAAVKLAQGLLPQVEGWTVERLKYEQ